MRIAFRVDASAQIGAGHLMRCLALGEAFRQRGAEVVFISGDHSGNMNDWIQRKGFALNILKKALHWRQDTDAKAEDLEQTTQALASGQPDWLVVDHYGIDISWEKGIRPFVNRLMVIDDGPVRCHDCDALLNQNCTEIGAEQYGGLVPPNCLIMLGTSYALIREDFGELRRKMQRTPRMENILVFFTCGDDQGESVKAMQGLEMYGKAAEVNVVVGRANKHINSIRSMCDALGWGYHCQVDYMHSLIAKADLVIGAGGASSWERCALGAPALISILADNQAAIAKALSIAGAARNLGWHHSLLPSDYSDALSSLVARDLVEMSDNAMRLVDGHGAERVADTLTMYR